jgi:hypothetical protein
VLAFLPWLHTRYAILALALGIVALLRLVREPDAIRHIAAFVMVPLMSSVGWFAFFQAIYGTGDPRAPYGGATQTALAYIPAGITGLLIDQQFGILSNAPVFAVAGLGLVVLWRRPAALDQAPVNRRWLPATLLLVLLPYLLGVTSYAMWWGGWSAPGRFAVPILLLLVVPAAAFWAWPPVRAARPFGMALLVLSVFVTGVLALVQRGILLYDVRGTPALWLEWIHPALHLSQALPSLFRDGHDGALALALVWAGWIGAAWLGLGVFFRRRSLESGAVALVTTAGLGLAITGAAATGWHMADERPFRHEMAKLKLLRQFDAGARPRGVSYRPPRIRPAEDFLPLVGIARHPEGQTPGEPLLWYPRIPAGQYRLHVEATSKVSDPMPLVVGRQPDAVLATVNQEGAAAIQFEREISLPVDVHSLALYGEGTAREALSHAVLQPLWLPRRTERMTSARALRAREYEHGVVYFLDDQAYMEPTGFWVRGGRQAQVVLARLPDPSGSVFRLFLRNGPIENRIHLQMGAWSDTITLAAGEEQIIALPAPPEVSAVLVGLRPEDGFQPAAVDPTSADQRWLGCWVEVR